MIRREDHETNTEADAAIWERDRARDEADFDRPKPYEYEGD